MIITGDTTWAAFWLLFGSPIKQLLPFLLVASTILALGVGALINLLAGRFASAIFPDAEDGLLTVDEADPERMVEIRPARRRPNTGTTCVSAREPTVVLRLPDEVNR